MRDFRDLIVWRKAHELTLDMYRVTAKFPLDERYGLTSQLRRSSASIAANLAEGCGRDSHREFAKFVKISSGSASETHYHLILACDLGLLDAATFEDLENRLTEVRRILTTLIVRYRDVEG